MGYLMRGLINFTARTGTSEFKLSPTWTNISIRCL